MAARTLLTQYEAGEFEAVWRKIRAYPDLDGCGESPADQRDPEPEVPRATGADHLAGLARRYAAGLQVIQGGAAPKPTGTR